MNNFYELPEGNVLISFSGGRTSAYMLNKILEQNGDLPERCKVVFANTGREMPETLDFVNECGEKWNVKIIWAEYTKDKPKFKIVNHNSASRNGKPFEQLIQQKKRLPTIVARFCTQELKVRTIKRYLVSTGWKKWTVATGIRADEANRMRNKPVERWDFWYPLNDACVSVKDVNYFWAKQKKAFNFDLRVKKGFGNCDGCFLKSEATLAAIWRDSPDRMKWWSDREKQSISRNNNIPRFRSEQTYEQLGNFIANQKDWIFDDEAFLCQSSHGECSG